MKRIFAAGLALLMAAGLLPVTALGAVAQGEKISASIGTQATQPASKKGDDGTTNWDFIEPVTHKKTVPAGYTAIRSAKDLDNVRKNLSGNFILTANIDLKGWGNWLPIGKDSAAPFKGIFDGNGYVVKNMTVDVQSTSGKVYAGLFGFFSGGSLKNLGISGGSVKGSTNASVGGIVGAASAASITNCLNTSNVSAPAAVIADVGGIVGDTSSPVKNCCNTGTVSTSATTNACAGGIAGSSFPALISGCYNMGKVSAANPSSINVTSAGGISGYSGTVINCCNKGSVSASAASSAAIAGGIAGNAFAAIASCCNAGAVNAAADLVYDSYAGGIAGDSSFPVTDCYNTGSVHAAAASKGSSFAVSHAGGIIGQATDFSAIKTCYNRGKVIASSYASYQSYSGGIAGTLRSSITNCYYAADSADAVGNNSGKITNVRALTIAQMKQKASFTGFDFSKVWLMGSSGCPELRVFHSHSPGAWKTVTAATAAKAGKQEQRCTVCNAVAATKSIPANHTIQLNKSSATLGKGETTKLTAATSVKTAVTWTSSKTSVATVSSGGTITAKGTGTAAITAKTAGGRTAKCTVTVKAAPTSVTLNKTAVTLGKGESYTLKATPNSGAASLKKTWSSSNAKVATVDSNGKVTAKATGSATVTVKTFNGKTKSCKVTVKAAPASVTLNKTAVTLGKGESYTLKATPNSGAASLKKTWSSSNTKVATVDSNGKITAKATGTATITFKTFNGKTKTCKVTVK